MLAPAIRYAREGIPVPKVIAHYWSFAPRLAEQPGFADVFLPDGRPLKMGETVEGSPLLLERLFWSDAFVDLFRPRMREEYPVLTAAEHGFYFELLHLCAWLVLQRRVAKQAKVDILT